MSDVATTTTATAGNLLDVPPAQALDFHDTGRQMYEINREQALSMASGIIEAEGRRILALLDRTKALERRVERLCKRYDVRVDKSLLEMSRAYGEFLSG